MLNSNIKISSTGLVSVAGNMTIPAMEAALAAKGVSLNITKHLFENGYLVTVTNMYSSRERVEVVEA